MPFVSNSSGFVSTTDSEGNPTQVGIIGAGEVIASNISGDLTGKVAVPGFSQYGPTMPVNCVLDTICLTVGNPTFNPAPTQTVYAFAMLATADGSSQLFTLHPATKVEMIYEEGIFYSEQVNTVRTTGLGFVLTAETRCIIVCGHYTTGDIGATSYTFSYAGTLLFQ